MAGNPILPWNTLISYGKFYSMPDSPDLSDLKALVKTMNQRDGNIKARRARIDAIVDEDLAVLAAVYQKLAQ